MMMVFRLDRMMMMMMMMKVRMWGVELMHMIIRTHPR